MSRRRVGVARLVGVGAVVVAVAAAGHAYATRPDTAPAPSETCRAVPSHGDYLPDRKCTPGARNPAVTQATLKATICRPGWAKTQRAKAIPSRKAAQIEARLIVAYGSYAGPARAGYELDHLVPISSGGALADERNLWPEAVAAPNVKDRVEAAAHAAVCSGRVPLEQVQRGFETDWVELGRVLKVRGLT